MSRKLSIKRSVFSVFNITIRVCVVLSMVLSSLALQTNNVFAKKSNNLDIESQVQANDINDLLESKMDSQNAGNSSFIPPSYEYPDAKINKIRNEIGIISKKVELSSKPKTDHLSNIVTSGTIDVTSSSGTQITGLSSDKTYLILAWGYYYFGCASTECYAGNATRVSFTNYGLTLAPREISTVGDMTLPNRYTRSWEFKPSSTGSVNIKVYDSTYTDNTGSMYYWVLENYLPDDQSLAPDAECHSNASSSQLWEGGPIDVYTGNYAYQSLDIDILTDQANELKVLKSYSSARKNQLSVMGYGWSNNNQIQLIFSDDDEGEDGYIILKMGDGSYLRFIDTGSTYYLPNAGISASLQQTTDTLGNTIYIMDTEDFKEYLFDENGILLSISDENNNALTFTYTSGLVTQVYDDSTSRYINFQYDTSGLLTTVTDNANRTVTYGYDTNSNLVSMTDVLGHTWQYEYDDTNFPHLLTEIIDPNGHTVERTVYNTEGKAIEQYDGNDDQTIQLVFNGDNTVTIIEGNVTKTAYYNDQNQLEGVVYSDGTSDSISYSSQYYPETITDESGNETQITWYGCNAPSQIIDAEGNTTTLSYDENSNVTSIVDGRGYETLFEYNDINLPHQMTGVIDPFENSTSIIYDSNGHVASSTNEKSQTTTFTYDTIGQLSSKVDSANNSTTFEYNNLGLLTTITNSLGIVTKNEYNDAGWVIRTVENFDNSKTQNEENVYNITTTYIYDLVGNVTHITDTYGSITEYVYDGKNQLIQIILPDSNVIHYSYDIAGNVVEEEDQRGNTTAYVYDARNRLVTISDDAGNNNQISYNANDTISSVTDARGYTTLYEYDGVDRVVSTTNPLNGVESTTYDEVGNITTTTDASGRTTNFEYDALNRLISQTDATGEITQYFYDEVDNLVQIIDPRGNPTTYTYNDLNQLITVTDASGHATSFTYDSLGQIISLTDANGNITTISYDDLGRQVALIDDLNQSTNLTYDALGRITVYEDALDREWQYSYDVLGRVDQETDPMNGVTTYTYDSVGNLLTENNVNGYTTTYTYDNINRIASIVDANNHSTSPAYDAIGNIVSITDAAGNATSYTYDALNRQVSITDAENNQTFMAYDAVGNLTSITDANGIITQYGYDSLNRLQSVVENYISGAISDEDTNVTTAYSYDENGNLLSVTDANSHTDSYTYNVLNQLSTESDALGNTKSYTYDNVGNLSRVNDGNNAVISYTYDELNRIVNIDYPSPDADVTFTYDAVGQMESMTDGLGITNWDYDDLGRPISITDPYQATVSYAYDAIGNRTGMTYPDGKAISYTYDPANRLTSVNDWDSQATQYTYNVSNYLERVDLPNGVFSEYDYDAIGRVTSLIHQTNIDTLSTYLYSYDNVGNVIERQELFGETIFTDDFESQNLSTWSSYSDDPDISISDFDPIYQDYSLSVSIDDSADLFVTDGSPVSESQYNARFYITPYYLEMSDTDLIDVFSAENDSGVELFGVRLGYSNSKFQIKTYAYDDETTLHESNWIAIGRSVHSIEVGWQASSADGNNDGILQLWIDGELAAELNTLDTDTQSIDSISLGAMNIQGTEIQGGIIYDEFISSHFGLIGVDTAIKIGYKPDFIFSDGFEDGTYDAWAATQSANISINTNAAIEDVEGLEVALTNVSSVYLSRQTPDEESQFISRFYFNPNSVDIENDSIGIYGLYSLDSQEVVQITLSESEGRYYIYAETIDDSDTTITSNSKQIGNYVHAIEIHWQQASSDSLNDGYITVWIDGTESISLQSIDNDTVYIGNILIGAGISDTIESTSTGNIYFDSFEAHRETEIGFDPERINPLENISDAILWLDASQITDLADGDHISVWEDLSGSGNTTEQSTAIYQPIYTVNAVNGNPAIVFDGYNDYLDMPNLFIDSDTTIIIVAQNEVQTSSTVSARRPILVGDSNPYSSGGTEYALGYKRAGVPGYGVCNGTTCIDVANGATGEYEFHEFIKSGTNAELYRDGELIGKKAFNRTSGFGTGYRIGADLNNTVRRYKGGVAEILVYDRALSDLELKTIEEYLSEKYAIELFVPEPTPTPTITSTLTLTGTPTLSPTPTITRTPGPTMLPMQISDSVLWLDASQMYGYSDGDAISYWEDYSDNGNQAEQSIASSQPIYSTNAVNGLPVLVFDGYNDYLNMPDLFIDSDTTIIIVAQNETQTSSTASIHRTIFAGDSNPYPTSGTEYALGYFRSGVPGFNVSLADSYMSINFACDGEYEFIEFRKSNTDGELYIDGEQLSTTTFSKTSGFGTGYRIGADLNNSVRRYKGGIAEIIVYNRALSDSELDQLETYLSNKYAITIVEPSPTSTVTVDATETQTTTATLSPTITGTPTITNTQTVISSVTPTPSSTSTSTPTPVATETPTPVSTATSTPSITVASSDTPVPTSTDTSVPAETVVGTESGSVIDDAVNDKHQYASMLYDESSTKSLHVMAKLNPHLSGPLLSLDDVDQITRSGLAAATADGLHDQTITYSYDALNRLTGADYHDGTYFNYSYDAVGNILSEQTQDGTSTYTYDAADRISTLVNNNGTFNYTWDGNGNLLSDGVTTYTYNAANQMTSLTSGTDVYSYAYNGLGDRYQQTINGVSTTYQLDLATNLTQVLNDGENTYLYGLDRIAQVSTTQTGYFLPDALGSVRQVVDPQADLQLSRSYTPFGEELTSSGDFETSFAFAGEMQDASGLLYLRARYLSTETGRFISADPFSGYLNYPASMNPYQYGYNNPLRYVDPSGEIVLEYISGLLVSTGAGALLGGGINAVSQYLEYGNLNCIDWGEVGKAALVGAVGGALTYVTLTGIAALEVGTAAALLLTIGTDFLIGEDLFILELALHNELDTYEFSLGRAGTTLAFSIIGFNGGKSSLTHIIENTALENSDNVLASQLRINLSDLPEPTVLSRGAFGTLSQAAENGILSYNILKKNLKKINAAIKDKTKQLFAHHLIEKRFAKALGFSAKDTDTWLSIAVTKEEHQIFTKAWREAIGYIGQINTGKNTANASKDDIWIAVQKVYQDYPEIVQILGKQLGY